VGAHEALPSLTLWCALGSQARAFVRLDSTTATFVCMACVLAATQEYMMERVAMQQFLVARELEHERQARREEAIVAERRRVAAEEAARFEKSFGYICALRPRATPCVLDDMA
jgi:hypothetical protein